MKYSQEKIINVPAYTHSLNKQLVEAFIEFCEVYFSRCRPINLQQDLIDLDKNQYNNFQKLQYFNLVERIPGRGWIPTKIGIAFYYGEKPVMNPVATLGGNVLPDNHEAWRTHSSGRRLIFIHEVCSTHYKKRPEYQAEASPQSSLFSYA